jgi:hypothetical protein
MLFQPATSYCEICHTFRFDFKSQAELLAALGRPDGLRKHTINKGITCEECQGAGAGMPSNCERCHRRFAWNADEAKKDGKPFINLLWSFGRTSWGDGNVEQGGGCHSPIQSQLSKELHFTSQKMVYEKVAGWQEPLKDGVTEVRAFLEKIRPDLAASRLPQPQKAQAQLMANQAQEILEAIMKVGSWGVHAPDCTQQKVKKAMILAEGAQATPGGRTQMAIK